MTIEEWFGMGQYRDFFLLDDEVYILPLGYTLTRNPVEKSNVVTMANGRKRQDIIRQWTKFSFAYATVIDMDYQAIDVIVKMGVQATSKILYLRKPLPADNADYETAIIDIISTPKTGYAARGAVFVHTGITLEVE